MPVNLDDYELVDDSEEFEEIPDSYQRGVLPTNWQPYADESDYPRTITSRAQLPESILNAERDNQARQTGFMQSGTGLLEAVAPRIVHDANIAKDIGSAAVHAVTAPVGKLLGYAGNLARSIPADVAALWQANQQGDFENVPVGNIEAALGGESLPIDQSLQDASEEQKLRGETPYATIAGNVSQNIAKLAPRLALAGMTGGATLPGQMASAAGAFGITDEGGFDMKQAAIAAGFPVVGHLGKLAVAMPLSRAVLRGSQAAANPAFQKSLEMVGDNVAQLVYSAAVDTPELLRLSKENPEEFQKRLGEMIGMQLGFSLLGARHLRGETPSETQKAINSEARLLAKQYADSGLTDRKSERQLADAEAEDLFQLKEAQKSGKLTVEDSSRLDDLEHKQNNPDLILNDETKTHLQDAMEEIGGDGKLRMAVRIPDDSPLAGQVATINEATGEIVINPSELNLTLDHLPTPEARKQYVRSLISEESIHLAAYQKDPEMGKRFLENSTKLEQELARRRYTGTASGKTIFGTDISSKHLGDEMLRLQMQRLLRMTPTEVAQTAAAPKLDAEAVKHILRLSPRDAIKELFRYRITTKTLVALENAVFDMRKLVGTGASAEQVKFLNEVSSKLNAVKASMGMPPTAKKEDDNAAPEAFGPGAVRMAGETSPEELMKMPKDEANKFFDEIRAAGNATQNDAVLHGMKLTDQDVPKLQELSKQVRDETMKAVQANDGEAYKAAFGKMVWLNGAIEGAKREGPNYQAVTARLAKEQAQPASIRRGGPSKRGQEIAEQKRRIVEMQARARGEELPPELTTPKVEPRGAAVPAEERSAPETWGFITPTPAQISQNANEVLGGEIKSTYKAKSKKRLASDIERSNAAEKGNVQAGSTTYDRPSFQKFVDSFTGKGQRAIAPEKLREAWEDSVWSSVMNATPERLESLRKALGLEKNYGSSKVAESKIEPETDRPKYRGEKSAEEAASAAKDWRRSAAIRMTEAVKRSEARRRYRLTLTRAIAMKLIEEANEGRPSLDRATVGVDDVAFDGGKTPYTEINRQDLADPKRLKAILRDGARGSSSDPETVSHRLVAVVDGAGRVHLVSTYNDAGVQRAVSPLGTGMRHRPHEEVDAAFLKRYRPFAAILLTDPIKGFKQTFKSVSEFNDQFAREVAERARVGDWDIVPEGPSPEDFVAEGTEGIRGEGGSFMGPEKGIVAPGAGDRSLQSSGPITANELSATLDHIMDESLEFQSPADVEHSLEALVFESERNSGKISAHSRLVVNSYRKVFDAIEARNPDLSREEIIDRMAAKIYENYQTSETPAEFVRKSMAEFAPQGARPAGPQPEAARGRELTQMRDVAPTTVRGQQGPTLPSPSAELGSKTPVREPYIPSEHGPAALRRQRATIPAPEEVLPDTTSPIPRFIPNVNTALTKAMGLERIPLVGRLWGARGKIKDAVDREIVGYSVKRSIGNSQAALIGARMAALDEQLGKPFKQDKDGKILNLKAAPSQSRFPSDVFEAWQQQEIVPEKMTASRKFSENEIADYSEKHPRTITLDKSQDRLFREMLKVIEDGYKYLGEKNAKLETYNGESRESRERQQVMVGLPKGVEWHAFPRVALFKRSVGPLKTEIKRRIGGSYGVEQERLYKTEAQGQQTTAYEPDMTKRLVAFTQRIYKAVADADLANSETLKGEKPEQRVGKLAKQYESELRSGEMTQQDILGLSKQARLGIEGEISSHPAFSGKIYPIKIAQKLDKAFGEQSHKWVRAAAELSTASKAFMLTGDLAQYMQQGGPMMLRHPGMWANATVKSLRSIADPVVTGKYLLNRDNYRAATEFVQSGGSLGHLQDFMSGSQPGEMATRVPAFRQVVIRSGRAFGTFFDIAKIEMWKGLRESTPKDQWPQVVETIENTVLSGRMESAGMNHARATGERIMLMASAYYRGAINLVAGMAEKGVAGSEARKTLASYAGGLTLLMVGSYLAAGMSWEEIRKRLMPGLNNPKFLSYPVKVGGETVEVGPGGIVLNLASLGVDVGMTLKDDPKALVSFGLKNPLIKWLTTKLGPIPGMGRKVATGEDAFGNPVKPVSAALETIEPIPLQKAIKLSGSSKKGASLVSGAASFVGLNANKYKASNEVYDLANKFIDKEGLRKSSGWKLVQNDDASYTKLRSAVASGSQKRFNELYEKLSETHTDAEIRKAMEQWVDRPFTGSEKNEALFLGSLNDHELELYLQAKEERLDAYANFMEMISEVP